MKTSTFFYLLFSINIISTLSDTSPCTPLKQFTLNYINAQQVYLGTPNSTQPPVSATHRWYLIKSGHTPDLVADASDPKQVRIQKLTGQSQQQWRFEPADRPGVYYIINKYTGTVLDVPNTETRAIAVNGKQGSLSQQWILNSNGRIFNVGVKLNLDIGGARYEPGNALWAVIDNGNRAQEFTLQENLT